MSLQRSLRTQLLTLLAGSTVLLILIALLCFNQLSRGIESYQQLLGGTLGSAHLVNSANLELKTQVQVWKNVLLRGKDPVNQQKYWGQFVSQEQKVNSLLTQLLQRAQHQQNSALANQVEKLITEHERLGKAYRAGHDQFLAANADPLVGDKAVKGVDRAASEQMSELVTQLNKQGEQESKLIAKESSMTMTLGIIILLTCSLLISLFSLWLVNHQILHPIHKLITHITRLSQGEFQQTLSLQRQDELGELALAAERLRDSLANTFAQIKSSTDLLDNASQDLQQISAVMAQGTQDQYSRTDMLATAMHEMSATAQDVAHNAATAAHAANLADHSAKEGEQVMQETIQAITHMSHEIENTAGVIQRLDEDSRRISTVLEVIRTIAEQTNLLALNAAIEAARAGEQGRGFAVVADEVRTLAKRTADSTAEINKIIDKVQSGTANAVQAIATGQEFSTQSVSQVTQAGVMLRNITQAIGDIHNMNQQIATAAEEQTSVAEDISRNLVDIKDIATRNDDNAQMTRQASQQLHHISVELGKVLHHVTAQA